jgi:hypothetical protein
LEHGEPRFSTTTAASMVLAAANFVMVFEHLQDQGPIPKRQRSVSSPFMR